MLELMEANSPLTMDHMKAGVIWQRAKKGAHPWQALPVPRGAPVVYGPEPTPPTGLIHCYLKPAHDTDEMYVVHVPCNATVSDVLKNLESITHYDSKSMIIVKEGCVLATYEHAAVCNPMAHLLVGDILHLVDVVSSQAAEWSDLWSVSHTTEPLSPGGGSKLASTCDMKYMEMFMDAVKPSLGSQGEMVYGMMDNTSAYITCRGGARNERAGQQPRAVMLVWAEDKIKRELEGVNLLTVRMLLKAEQRTVSAILHKRTSAQTKEVLQAACRRAGLTMTDASLPLQPEQHAQAQDGLRDMMQAMHNQTIITAQIADRLSVSPTNQEFAHLLEVVNKQVEMQQILIEQTERIMLFLNRLNRGPRTTHHPPQKTFFIRWYFWGGGVRIVGT